MNEKAKRYREEGKKQATDLQSVFETAAQMRNRIRQEEAEARKAYLNKLESEKNLAASKDLEQKAKLRNIVHEDIAQKRGVRMAHQEALAKSVDYQEANLLSKFHGDETNKNAKPKKLAEVIEKRYNY